jgi:hypothetical protein
MLMGSADAIPTAPTTAVVFVEDLPEDAQAKAAMARAPRVHAALLALPDPPTRYTRR